MAEKKKSLRSMTKKELSLQIHKRVDVINERLQMYYDDGNSNVLVDSEVRKLILVSGKGRGKGNRVGYGIRGKRKNEMIRQLSELNYFEKWDIFTPEGQKQLAESEQKSYETFSQGHPGWSFEKWRGFANILGALGEAITEQFGSLQIREMVDYIDDSGKDVPLTKILDEVYIEARKTGGFTQESMVDLTFNKINEYIKKE